MENDPPKPQHTSSSFAGQIFHARGIDKFPRLACHPQTAAEMAWRVIGNLLAAPAKHLGLNLQNIHHERTEINQLIFELPDLHPDPLILSAQFGIVLFQVRTAGSAQREHKIIARRVNGFQVLYGHFPGRFIFAHHHGRQTAAGLFHGVFQLHVVVFEETHQGLSLFRIDKIHQASPEEGHPVSGLFQTGIDPFPHVPQWRPGHRRQAAEPMFPGKEEGQVAQILPFGDGLLGEVGPAQEEMEELAIPKHALQQPVLDGRLAFDFQDGPVNPLDQVGEVDAGGADRLAGLAVEAGF